MSRIRKLLDLFRKRHESDEVNEYVRIARAAFAVAILIFICIYVADCTNMASKAGLVNSDNSRDWASYSINYFGAVSASFIGFIGTIMAVAITSKRQERVRKEDNRKSVLPLIQISSGVLNTSSCDAVMHCKYGSLGDKGDMVYTCGNIFNTSSAGFELRNVGQREMYNVCARCIEKDGFLRGDEEELLAPILYKDEPIIIGLDIQSAVMKDYYDSPSELSRESRNITKTMIVEILFNDCYGNKYSQNASINVTYMLAKTKRKVRLIFDNSTVTGCKIISAPEYRK